MKDGDKDVETSMSATATADVTVSQKTTFTTTIDLSKIVVEMKKSIMITINTRRKMPRLQQRNFLLNSPTKRR